jgi:hypothetical protein
MFNQSDQIAAKLLPAVEAATSKPKITPPIGELLSIGSPLKPSAFERWQ